MSSELAIEVENLSKCYHVYGQPRDRLKQAIVPRLARLVGLPPPHYFHEFWALRDISFEVRKGESVGVVGMNGSGKSTLLQIITGTLAPTTGKVVTRGRIAALLELGSGFDPNFTGRENVYLNGALLGLTRAEIDARFDAIAAFADIGEHLEQPVKTYSSGMMVRLAFAVQVQVDPDILIVDEALAVGDALFQKRCFDRVEKLVSNGTTVLFVSHDQESVRTLTSRALLLHHGRPRAWGLSSEVVLAYRRLLHDAEADYFASVARDLAAMKPETAAPPAAPPVPDASASPLTSTLSFGDGGVRVVSVQTLNEHGEPCALFHPGEPLKIRITCESAITTDKLNVAVRIRNKEGIKVYSWGTLNQDMAAMHNGSARDLFWTRQVRSGERFEVTLEAPCNLGANLYEVQASVSLERTPDYQSQRMLHWVDEAAFFQVLMQMDRYFFGGVADLRMNATWQPA